MYIVLGGVVYIYYNQLPCLREDFRPRRPEGLISRRRSRQLSSSLALCGGLMFGYDVVGVSGGVTSMGPFLKKFFPGGLSEDKTAITANTITKALQLFTSSLYSAGLTSTFFASYTRLGRKLTELIAGVFFIIGVAFNAAAKDLAAPIVRRILLGCGVGFANQAVPLFHSEKAPARIRGGPNILFRLKVTIGILFINLVNYGSSEIKGGWGWRLSLGLAGIQAVLLTAGPLHLLVVDTPNSLMERGRLEQGKAVLRKIRGTDNVEPELLELVEANRIAKEVKHPLQEPPRNRPQLIVAIAVALQIFQQFTGINAIMFYAPVLFNTLGFGGDASLYSAVITGAVNVISTIYSVDKVGRRFLLLEAGVRMFFSQVVIAIVLGIKVTDTSSDLPSSSSSRFAPSSPPSPGPEARSDG